MVASNFCVIDLRQYWYPNYTIKLKESDYLLGQKMKIYIRAKGKLQFLCDDSPHYDLEDNEE